MTDTLSNTQAAVVTGPKETVTQFLSALERFDVEAAEKLIGDNIVYTNVSLPSLRGKSTVITALRQFAKVTRRFDAKIHSIAENSTPKNSTRKNSTRENYATVLTERTDAMEFGPFRMQFWVCGTFEVQDGRITLWRDYFDWANITLAVLRGFLGIVIPAVRAKI